MIKWAVGWMVAIVAAVFAMPAAEATVVDSVQQLVTHACYSPHTPNMDGYTHYDRGPPSARVDLRRHRADGSVARGPSTGVHEVVTATNYSCDVTVPFLTAARGERLQGVTATATTQGHAQAPDRVTSSLAPAGVAAKGVDEAGALVRYDPKFASRNLLGQLGDGWAVTPGGRTVSAHAAERIVYGAPGRSPTTLARVDEILDNSTRSVYRFENDAIRVYSGKDWVVVSGSDPNHIVTVMVR